jgi:hypothetical protein
MNKMAVVILFSLIAGCSTFAPREIAQPSQVTVKDAVFEVADALRDVQDRVPPEKRAGLIADEVTVVFNIAAGSTVTDKAGLTISNVPLAGGALGGNIETQNVSNASRGNTITIKFKNIATAETGAGEGNRTLVFSLEGCCSTIELHPHPPTVAWSAPKSEAARRTLLASLPGQWWRELDLNQRRHSQRIYSQRIYSPSPLTTRATTSRRPATG